MKIFITGATGVVGKRVVPLLVAQGHEVTAVARAPEGRAALERAGARAASVDLFDRAALTETLGGHDALVNLATHMPATSTRMFLPGAWSENDRIRRDGSAALVDAALNAGVKRFIQESFAPVYPDRGSAWIDETTPIEPARYNRTITDAEESAARFGAAGGAHVILRFAAFYGPDSRFFDDIVQGVRRGLAFIPGRPDAFISSVAHDDAAAATVAALGVPPGIYNVSDDEPVTHREFVDSLAEALGVSHPRLPPAWMVALGGSLARTAARSLRVSNRKLKEASGWMPVYPSVRAGWPSAVTRTGAARPAAATP